MQVFYTQRRADLANQEYILQALRLCEHPKPRRRPDIRRPCIDSGSRTLARTPDFSPTLRSRTLASLLVQDCAQFVGADRFDQVAVEAGAQGASSVFGMSVSRDRD